MFLSDFGSETLRSAFSGRRESLRLFSATPPAMPASAAPPASSGVFALEASWATLPPVFATAPFELVLLGRAREVVARPRLLRPRAEPLRELVRLLRELPLREPLLRVLVLPLLELPRLERVERLPLLLLLVLALRRFVVDRVV
jgi:hypothetical protein